jgi:predicted alpha/beta superfamily hydrolase
LTFEEKIGGPDSYIKVKEVVQNPTGQQYAVVYFDDGQFFMRIFGKEQRTKS